MPVYKGSQKVTPTPGGMEVARVYRGDRLVYTSAVPSIYPVSGTWTGSPGWGTVMMGTHTIVEAGTFTVTQSTTGGAIPSIKIRDTWIDGNVGRDVTWTGSLAVGDVVGFGAYSFNSVSGSWTVTKH